MSDYIPAQDAPFDQWFAFLNQYTAGGTLLEVRGNRVYFCLRYENLTGQVGPFGPMPRGIIS